MRKFVIVISAIVILATLGSGMVACSSNQQAASTPTVLRLAVPWPTGDPVTNNIQEFVDKFNAQASGKYTIELHPGESLVKIGDSVDALRTGAVEMAGWPTGVFASLDPVFAAAEIPFMANNVEADAAMQVDTMPLYDQVMEAKFNSKPLFTFACVALDIISTKPVKTAADWNGLLCQSVSPQSAQFIEAMGGSSVPMPFPDAYQGLQKKVIDASMESSPMMIMFKLNEVAKYVTRGYLIPASLMVAINMDAYNKMPKDIKDLIVKLGLEAQTSTNAYFVSIANQNTQTLKDMGMDVYILPKSERDKWAQMSQPVVDSLLSKMGTDFSQKLLKIAADANAKYPYQQ